MIGNRQDLQESRERYATALQNETKKILVCAGTGCVAGGSLEIFDRLKKLVEDKGLCLSVELADEPHTKSIGLKKSGCHGFCEMGPLVRIEPFGWLYIKVKLDDCEEILQKSILDGEPVERLLYAEKGITYAKQSEIPFYKKQMRLVLEHCGHLNCESIEEYIAMGGYGNAAKALFDLNPGEIIAQMKASNLRGRGGGGYPAGRKWEQVAAQPSDCKYIVCNGDEGDPGAFMD
ncbi:MAG: NADH-quinone oxidoreductase subunit F, partial [Eubacteriales bacterium]